MHSEPVSRRAFLAGGAGVALGVAATATAAGPLGALVTARSKAISPAVLSSDLYASPTPQRFVFGIYRGPKPASFGPARVAFAPPGARRGTFLDTELYKEGLPKGRGIYVVDATLPTAGVWNAAVALGAKRKQFVISVKPAAEAPLPGTTASTAPSPTPAIPLGVNPMCTRQPACPLHDVSLTDVIGQGQPVAVMFATPALCQSQYCGPVLDQLLDVMAPYQQRGVRMVHVEIYTSNRGATLAPTVEAWNLPSEPWFYSIDGAGIIRDRLDGAMATNEMTAALDRLVA